MTQLRIGIIGAGRLGGFHAQKAAAHPDVHLTGIADPNFDAACLHSEKLGCTPYSSYHDLLEEVDAVVVAAPTYYHHQIGLDCLNRGVHVLMEKPITIRPHEADELVAAASANRCVLQVGHVERFNPALDSVLSQINSPRYIEGVRSSPFTFRSTDVGVVLDLMIHDIDLVLSMVGSSVRKVSAFGASVVGGHEDMANARLEFENGCIASLNASRVSSGATRMMKIWAQDAFVTVDFGSRQSQVVRPSETLMNRQFDIDSLSPDELEYMKQNFHAEHLPITTYENNAVDALAMEMDDFVDSIKSDRRPRVSGSDGRNAVSVAEMVLDSIERHAWDGVGRIVGPNALPVPAILPDSIVPAEDQPMRRKAG